MQLRAWVGDGCKPALSRRHLQVLLAVHWRPGPTACTCLHPRCVGKLTGLAGGANTSLQSDTVTIPHAPCTPAAGLLDAGVSPPPWRARAPTPPPPPPQQYSSGGGSAGTWTGLAIGILAAGKSGGSWASFECRGVRILSTASSASPESTVQGSCCSCYTKRLAACEASPRASLAFGTSASTENGRGSPRRLKPCRQPEAWTSR
jgi:hypothetical protein